MDHSLFDYTYIDNYANRTLFLLHGTGGTKQDFLFLNDVLHNTYNLVGLEGNVDELGMKRFFKRVEEGVFDQESIKEESTKLQLFIKEWNIKENNNYFLGYSNGANILLSTLFYYPHILHDIVLLHPMLPFPIKKGSLDLSVHRIFLSQGMHDPMISDNQQRELQLLLESCGAMLTTHSDDTGHAISQKELEAVVGYLLG